MNAKLLSPSQTAQLLGIGVSTLRLWSEQFKDHLSESAHSDGKRRRHYTPDDIAMLTHARDLLREGRSVADVAALLAVVPEHAGALITIGSLADEVTSARAALKALGEEWHARQAEHDKAIADLRGEVAALREEVSALERRSWWDRLLNRKGKPAI